MAGEATAADSDPADTDPKVIFGTEAPDASAIRPLGDLDKLRARGSRDGSAASSRTREAIGPILLIFLLQQNRFADGLDILQPVTGR